MLVCNNNNNVKTVSYGLVLSLLVVLFFKSGDDGAFKVRLNQATSNVGTIKVIESQGEDPHKLVCDYPSKVKTSSLWYFPKGDKGILVRPWEDEEYFAFNWLPLSRSPASTEAFVTLVGSNDHVLGARVLGRSIELTETKKDRVILATNLVSLENLELLEKEGWRVAIVPFIENPFIKEEKVRHLSYQERHERGRRKTVLCKLHIWNLVEYSSVFYLDTDAIVIPGLKSVRETCGDNPSERVAIDKIFDCGKNGTDYYPESKIGQFCAFQHLYTFKSTPVWEFNAGVLVVKPSRQIFRDILTHARWLGTNGNFGDQGTLARYFFYTCTSGGNFLLGDPDKRRQVSQLQCKYPDSRFLETASPLQVRQFRNLCSSVGQSISKKKYALLPFLYTEPKEVAEDVQNSLDSQPPQLGLGELESYKLNKSDSDAELVGVDNSNEADSDDEDDDDDFTSAFSKDHFWRRGVRVPEYIDNIYDAQSSGCQQLDRIWHTWITDDSLGTRQCQTTVVHFLDADRKPWFWRFWPVGGYYQIWREAASDLMHPWSDVKYQVIVWSVFPVLFSIAWSLLLLSIESGRIKDGVKQNVLWKGRSFLSSTEFPFLNQLCKLVYNQLKPDFVRSFIQCIPLPFNPLISNLERISIVLLLAFSSLGSFLSYQLTPSRLPPAVGWLIYFEWSLFFCGIGVSSWAALVYGLKITFPDSKTHELNEFESLPSGEQVRVLIKDSLRLAAIHFLLDIGCLAVLFVCGRVFHCSWRQILGLLPYIISARITITWLLFVKECLYVLRKLMIYGVCSEVQPQQSPRGV